ncbi:hypothetical protein CFB41_14335 [Burkholderia sp. AU33803]|nr:hypothetical protein CFB41_14335 [Burkholderia sp. AU33803]
MITIIKRQFPILILLLVFLASFSANAQSALPNIFTPVDGDKFMVILKSLFGGLINGDSSSDVFSSIMEMWNGAVATLGGIYLTYTIFTSVTMTAHDGEALGKEFHSFWVPVRSALGGALILPVINGYSPIQYVIIWCAMQGVGLADAVWSKFVSVPALSQISTVSFNNPDVTKLAKDILKAQMCNVALNTIYSKNPSLVGGDGAVNFGVSKDTSYFNMSTTIGLNGVTPVTTYRFGNANNSNGISPDYCGSVVIKPYDTTNSASVSQSLGDNLGITGQFTASAVDSINQAQQQAVDQMISTSQSIASNAVQMIDGSGGLTQANRDQIQSQVNSMINSYNDTVRKAASSTYNNAHPFADVSKSASQDGFALAGAWFLQLSLMQDRAQAAISSTPESSSIDKLPSSLSDELSDKYMTAFQDLTGGSLANGDYGVEKQTEIGGFMGWVKSGFDLQKPIQAIGSSLTNFAIQDNENPIMQMRRLGDWIFTTMIAVTAGAIWVGKFAALKMILMSPIVIMLFILGFTLSYVLPYTPFLMWFGMDLALIGTIVGAVIVGPLWIVTLLIPHGNALLGSTSNGAKMLLSLTLRPVLMIFGLATSIVILNVMSQFLNTIYTNIFSMSQAGGTSISAVIGILAEPLLYMLTMFVLIKHTLSYMHKFADELLSWIGGSSGGYGESSEKIAAAGVIATSQTTNAANTASNIANRSKTGSKGVNDFADSMEDSFTTSSEKKGSGGESSAMSEAQNKFSERKIDDSLANISDASSELGEAFKDSSLVASQPNNEEKKNDVQGFEALVNESHNALGGSHTEAGKEYSTTLASAIRNDPFMSKSDMVKASNSATISSFDTAYSSGASAIAKSIATKENGSISRTSLGKTGEIYQSVSSQLGKQNMSKSEIKDTLKQINSNALQAHQIDSSTPMQTHLNNSIDETLSQSKAE